MDVSGSTGSAQPGTRRTAQQDFLFNFMNDSNVIQGMQDGNIQMGFTKWDGSRLSMNLMGFL
ncbi:MAG: hypothetical protein CM15mV42_0630 [uncultured marine virus]|nr:MAG: hypothetical protein CM15mV42_0630 [uncultured marine virus]